MKRPIKPFVVEVRKGQKSQKKSATVLETPVFGLSEEQPRESDALRRAEAALFGGFSAKTNDSSANRPGRILETIADEEPIPEASPAVEGKRRGRPPGSRNKPKDVTEAAPAEAASEAPPKRRGRPPRITEAVRKVELTPELASAALESIARASVPRAPLPTRPAPRSRMAPAAAPKPVRTGKRGRPPKEKIAKEKIAREKVARVKIARGRPVRDEAAAARPVWRAPETQFAPAPAAFTQPRGPLDTLPRLLRIAAEKAHGDAASLLGALRRPRAGERWKRRLRGAALVAYERRLKKSGASLR